MWTKRLLLSISLLGLISRAKFQLTEGHATLSEEAGFGMTKHSANFTTFLPFFMELSLPYSFIRGETLVLKGVARNYMKNCAKVQATLENTNAFNAELKDGQQGACICTNGSATYTWEAQANIIGELCVTVSAETTQISDTCDGPNDPGQSPRKDTVVRTVTVEPEGINQEHTSRNQVFVNSGLFEVSLRSLLDLVQKPYGCGEQNLVRVALILAVLDYLNNAGQLTEVIYQKAKAYMSEGYYRHLFCASGGAYRLLQNSIENDNSMLTAYSFKTFEKAKKHIYVDEGRQQQTLSRLENVQRLDNGCFKSQGRLFTVKESETDREISLTAYVSIALLEYDYSSEDTPLTGALECLKNASKSEQKIYDRAIMLYAFTLAKLPEYSQPLLQSLMSKAKVEADTIHWEREDVRARKAVPFLSPYRSADVEITSYVLLSMAADPDVTQESLTKMAKVSMGLARQKNSHGGFVATSDTVVAIQALAAYAKLLYTPNSQQTVVVRKDQSSD